MWWSFEKRHLALLASQLKIRIVRADSGFFDDKLLSFLENALLPYIVVARLTRWIKSERTFAHPYGECGFFGAMFDRRRRFADNVLRNGETFLRGVENGRSDAERFLGHTECFLDDEENIFGGAENDFRDPKTGHRR